MIIMGLKKKIKSEMVLNRLKDLVLNLTDGSTYILLIYVERGEKISIGKSGQISLAEGFYIYIGSAKKTIHKRLLRHLRREKNKFWHIDYLLCSPHLYEIVNIWINKLPCECTISQMIYQQGFGLVVKKGFGSSDCKCPTHFYEIKGPELKNINQLLVKKNFYSILPFIDSV